MQQQIRGYRGAFVGEERTKITLHGYNRYYEESFVCFGGSSHMRAEQFRMC